MEPYSQIEVLDFVRLMKDFFDRRIDVRQYLHPNFDLSKKRFVAIPEVDKILQPAYGGRGRLRRCCSSRIHDQRRAVEKSRVHFSGKTQSAWAPLVPTHS